MSNYEKLYWLTRIDSINYLFLAVAWVASSICIIIAFINIISMIDEDFCDDALKSQAARKLRSSKIRWLAPIAFIFFTLSALTPTRNEAVFIAAGGKAIDWAQSDTSISKIPSQTTAIISAFMENEIKKIKQETTTDKTKK